MQVAGSVSYSSIRTTTGNTTLTEDDYTVILGGNHNITLPTASTCKGRIYVIKNPINSNRTISTYLNERGNTDATINRRSALWLQSDGTNWQQIN